MMLIVVETFYSQKTLFKLKTNYFNRDSFNLAPAPNTDNKINRFVTSFAFAPAPKTAL